MTWYYVKDGEPAGPISDEELVSKLRLGAILPTTLVWRSGMTEWQAASKIAPPMPAPMPESMANPGLAVVEAPPELAAGAPPVLPNFFCTSCGKIIPADQLVRIGGRAVCAACKPAFVQQVREGMDAPVRVPVIGGPLNRSVPTGPDSDLADPAIRLVAHILDLVFLAVPIGICYVLFIVIAVTSVAGAQRSAGGNAATAAGGMFVAGLLCFFGLVVLAVFAYWTIFLGRRGATPGMRIMKVKMVRGNRGPLNYGLALGRTVLLYVINLFTMSLTNITAFFDREKRTVVDMICDTRVVRD